MVFEPKPVADAVAAADHVVVLLPDEVHAEAFAADIGPNLRDGASLIFSHGFAVAFDVIEVPAGHDTVLVAPKGQGHYLRKRYSEPGGLPCLVAVEQDASGEGLQRALSYAQLIGCLSAGAIRTTFRAEAVTDLFGEQVVLCGGVPALVKAAFRDPGRPRFRARDCLSRVLARAENNYGLNVQRRRLAYAESGSVTPRHGAASRAKSKSTRPRCGRLVCKTRWTGSNPASSRPTGCAKPLPVNLT